LGDIRDKGWGVRAALRHALAVLGLVAALTAAFPPIVSASAGTPKDISGVAVDTTTVNRTGIQPEPPRAEDIAAPAQRREKAGPSPQPRATLVDHVAHLRDAAPRPVFTTRAPRLAAAATIAAQPRAPPLSRT
jgi:hypothetical protein